MDYYIYQRRHFSLAYRSPWEYLQSAGFIRRVLAETGGKRWFRLRGAGPEVVNRYREKVDAAAD